MVIEPDASAKIGEAMFLDLVKQYQTLIYQHAFYLLNDPDDAKDVTQETFIKAWRNVDDLRLETVQSWLLKCANNQCIDLLRRRRFQAPLAKGDDAEFETLLYHKLDAAPSGLSEASPEDLCVKQELQRLVQQAIAQLPLHFRTALVMREIEGLSFEEIAGVLRQPVGTVKSNVFRARQKLRDTLKKLLALS
jgi:RNA polymerase sigma-70 factor (ECF subfamily)